VHHCAGGLCRKVACVFVLHQWNYSCYLEIAFTFWFTRLLVMSK
jgi:hypothetical protein